MGRDWFGEATLMTFGEWQRRGWRLRTEHSQPPPVRRQARAPQVMNNQKHTLYTTL